MTLQQANRERSVRRLRERAVHAPAGQLARLFYILTLTVHRARIHASVPASNLGTRCAMKTFVLLASLVLYCVLAPLARADSITVLSVSGPSDQSAVFSDGTGTEAEYLGVAFVLGQVFKDVAIAAPGIATNSSTATAWLVNGIGPGATSSNVIATTQFNSGFNQSLSTPLLSGLDLFPGSYFFLVSVPPQRPLGGALGVWPFINDPTVFSLPTSGLLSGFMDSTEISSCPYAPSTCLGTINFAFPPASVWEIFPSYASGGLSLNITGTPVPEPSSLALMLCGLLAVMTLSKKRKA